MGDDTHSQGAYFCPLTIMEPGETNFELIPNSQKPKVWQNKSHFLYRLKFIFSFKLSYQTPSKDEFVVTDVQPIRSNIPEAKLFVPGKRTKKEKKELPPWRSSDRHPRDTIRFNYLNNYDPIEQARQA